MRSGGKGLRPTPHLADPGQFCASLSFSEPLFFFSSFPLSHSFSSSFPVFLCSPFPLLPLSHSPSPRCLFLSFFADSLKTRHSPPEFDGRQPALPRRARLWEKTENTALVRLCFAPVPFSLLLSSSLLFVDNKSPRAETSRVTSDGLCALATQGCGEELSVLFLESAYPCLPRCLSCSRSLRRPLRRFSFFFSSSSCCCCFTELPELTDEALCALADVGCGKKLTTLDLQSLCDG